MLLLLQIMCGIYAAITARGYTVQQQQHTGTAFTQLKNSYADDTATHYSDNSSSARSGSTSSSDSSRATSPHRNTKLALPLTVADAHSDMLLSAPYA
jgi:hypothetical protein